MELTIGGEKMYMDFDKAKKQEKFFQYKEHVWWLMTFYGLSHETAEHSAQEKYHEFKGGEWEGSSEDYDENKWRVK